MAMFYGQELHQAKGYLSSAQYGEEGRVLTWKHAGTTCGLGHTPHLAWGTAGTTHGLAAAANATVAGRGGGGTTTHRHVMVVVSGGGVCCW